MSSFSDDVRARRYMRSATLQSQPGPVTPPPPLAAPPPAAPPPASQPPPPPAATAPPPVANTPPPPVVTAPPKEPGPVANVPPPPVPAPPTVTPPPPAPVVIPPSPPVPTSPARGDGMDGRSGGITPLPPQATMPTTAVTPSPPKVNTADAPQIQAIAAWLSAAKAADPKATVKPYKLEGVLVNPVTAAAQAVKAFTGTVRELEVAFLLFVGHCETNNAPLLVWEKTNRTVSTGPMGINEPTPSWLGQKPHAQFLPPPDLVGRAQSIAALVKKGSDAERAAAHIALMRDNHLFGMYYRACAMTWLRGVADISIDDKLTARKPENGAWVIQVTDLARATGVPAPCVAMRLYWPSQRLSTQLKLMTTATSAAAMRRTWPGAWKDALAKAKASVKVA